MVLLGRVWESLKFRVAVPSCSLVHCSNDVGRAYAKGEYWDERVRMMQWCADYLDELRSSLSLIRIRPVHQT